MRPLPIRVGIIGLGYRGAYLLRLLSSISSYRVVALADPRGISHTMEGISMYADGEEGYKQMIDECPLDLVFIASPWHCQRSQAEYCLERGIHIALEIKGGLADDEYDNIIRLSQRHQCKVYPLENTLFMREVMAVGCMIEQGVFGELVYLRGGYRHDLRSLLLGSEGEEHWRRQYYEQTNGDLYPTHGLAPLYTFAGLGRIDRATRLVTTASRPIGLSAFAHSLGRGLEQPIRTADIICTHIETERGILIGITHDTTLPRPKSLDYEVQGTKGLWHGHSRQIYLEGISPHEEWEDDECYIVQYEHRMWRRLGAEALRYDAHHKGMDYMMLVAVSDDLLGHSPYPASIHDLAFWCQITPLSARSLREQQSIPLI